MLGDVAAVRAAKHKQAVVAQASLATLGAGHAGLEGNLAFRLFVLPAVFLPPMVSLCASILLVHVFSLGAMHAPVNAF